MAGLVRHARLGLGQRRRLRSADQIVQRALLLAEASVDREGAGDIRCIATELCARIYQQQIPVDGARVIGAIVQHTGIGAGADDAAVSGPGIVGAENALDIRLKFVFVDAWTGRAHRHPMRFHADVGGTLHQLQFVLGLEQTQLMQKVAELQEFVRRLRAVPDLLAHPVDPTDQLEIELGIAAEVVIDPRPPFQQAGQDLVQVFDGIGIVHAELFDRAFLPGTGAIPALPFQIAFPAEQQRLAMPAAGHQYQHRFGLVESAEVPEIGILAIRIMSVVAAHPFRRGGQDQDRIVGGHPHQLLAAPRELGGGDARRLLH